MSSHLPQVRSELMHAQDFIRTGERGEARKILVQLLTADRSNEEAWLLYVSTFSNAEFKEKALRAAVKSLPHSFKLTTELQEFCQSSNRHCTLGELRLQACGDWGFKKLGSD